MSNLEELTFKYMYPSELQDNPMNWREHPEEQTEALDSLIFGEGGVGWAGAALVNNRTVENGWLEEEAIPTLIDGHDRKSVAEKNEQPIPVLIGEWSPEDEATILTTLDPIGSLAQTNTKKLSELLSTVRTKQQSVRKVLDNIRVTQLRVKEEVPDRFTAEDAKGLPDMAVMPTRIYNLDINQLEPNDYSAHAMSSTEYKRLVNSIQSIGLLEPFIVRPLGDGKFEIVDGQQRYRAALELGMTTVPCLIKKYTEDQARLANLASNRLRGKFIPKRLAENLNKLREKHGDEVVTKTIGMEKKRMDSFGEESGYEFKVDDTGVIERDYREYGEADYTDLDDKLTFIVSLESLDFQFVEESLNKISPNWSIALPEMAKQWREHAPEQEA